MTYRQPKYNYVHHVDDENKIVHVHGGTWASSMTALAIGHNIWPDHKIALASLELVERLNGGD